MTIRLTITAALSLLLASICLAAEDEKEAVRVFIFAGQSNMVGSDSKVADIVRFPPFVGLEAPQPKVKFTYNLGRENKQTSEGWVDLQPVNNIVGPELSFARKVTQKIDGPIAIIKVAAGGTHLGGDWNPDNPDGFKMYPLALEWIRAALADFDSKKIPYRIEGFMWHQGENDMFEEDYMANYGKNLANLLASWRRDLKTPDLKFYIGELCTKTIWGMDLRPRMDAISKGQRAVTKTDPLAEYIPTAHVGVEIGGGGGLHYHYGTLGQLEHGVNYADAYLRTIGKSPEKSKPLEPWPYAKGSKVKLFIMAGHRNMEGERAFVQELEKLKPELLKEEPRIAYKYHIGGGYKVSDGWEPLRPAGFYDTFGPELSLGRMLQEKTKDAFAIAKFTHSGSQIIDWTPEGSMAKSRHLYPKFIRFINDSIKELEAKGNEVELAGVFYHVGENDMSFSPYREKAAERLQSIVKQSREDLALPKLKWFVSQQPPTDDEGVNKIDVTAAIEKVAAPDDRLIHIKAFDLPKQEKKLVIDTEGIVRLGEVIAKAYLDDLPRVSLQLEILPAISGRSTDWDWWQARTAFVPVSGEKPLWVTTMSETGREGTHNFHDIYQVISRDGGKTWTEPAIIPSLKRARHADGFDVAPGDLWPTWHANSGKVIATGKTFNFEGGKREIRVREKVSYAVMDPTGGEWKSMKFLAMPDKDHSGKTISAANAGNTQRVDLPDGDILLPVRYQRHPESYNYTSVVVRCGFDGETLTYKKHGSELNIPQDRGLYEPSLTEFGGRFFLTLRADHSAFVTSGTDGIHFDPIQEWKFDDGEPLGNYNTQQHWVTVGGGLFLIYTRKGADNDHVFRHRAPLFIGQVNPKTLRVMRATERVVLPENYATLGNSGVCRISDKESWITCGEGLLRLGKRKGEKNQVLFVRILAE
ncbi:hypothetical protein N9Z85_03530 [Akkermansiaceae bacterium]|nr:hypothetical protein [Akkermansiaceae bacterium]